MLTYPSTRLLVNLFTNSANMYINTITRDNAVGNGCVAGYFMF